MRLPSLLLLCLPLLASCAVDRAAVAAYQPDLLEEYDGLEAQEKAADSAVSAAEDALEAAVQSPDPADDQLAAEALADANQDLQQVETSLAAIDEKVIRKQSEPFNALPYGLGALLVEATVALASKRKRKLYASAFRNLSKGQLLVSAGDILKAIGAAHSSPKPLAPNADVSAQ